MGAIFLHPALTAAVAECLATSTGMDLRRTESGNFRLDPVQPCQHVLDYRRHQSVAYLRERGKYILDKGVDKPAWGNGSLSGST